MFFSPLSFLWNCVAFSVVLSVNSSVVLLFGLVFCLRFSLLLVVLFSLCIFLSLLLYCPLFLYDILPSFFLSSVLSAVLFDFLAGVLQLFFCCSPDVLLLLICCSYRVSRYAVPSAFPSAVSLLVHLQFSCYYFNSNVSALNWIVCIRTDVC